MRRDAQNSNGFTLIELILVITLVGVLASIATPSYLNYAQRARATQCHVDRGEAQSAIIQYYHDHSDTEITSLQQLIDAGYLRSGFNCPLGGEYVLVPAKTTGTPYPIIACSLHYVPDTVTQETTATPTQPATPAEPVVSDQPTTPITPAEPGKPNKPDKPDKPGRPDSPGKSNK
jgi:prepilin-type N-terminal cleavage/methylation domain-containing protein